MTETFLALANRLRSHAPERLSAETICAVKSARNDPALRAAAEAVMARYPADFPLFGARQAD